MHTNKLLIGNSGDRVYLHEDYVIKEAGTYTEKFKQQMNWLQNCNHPNFIKIEPISPTSYKMKKYPTWYDKITSQNIDKSLNQFYNLLSILNGFEGPLKKLDIRSYLDKLELRTGYKYDGHLDAFDSWGFVHGDLTISNILYDNDIIFIDPRGTEEHLYYDYGKLMQSFAMKYEAHIYNNWNDKYIKFCDEAERLMRFWYNSHMLNFYLAVHLLGAVPFLELNKRHELATLFLKKGHEIFDELEIKYER